jgi:hypothetical protein
VRDGFLMVVMVWALLPVFACLPFMFHLHASFTDAYFEAMSGLTTTGATVLSGLDALPPSINLWRGMLVWLGGMGLIVLAVAVLPLLGIGGRQMFKAETPGPMKDSSLTPRMAETAKGLWVVYGWSPCCASSPALGRHELVRRRDAFLHHHGPGRLLQPRRQLRPLEFAADRRRHRGLHADRGDEFRHALPRRARSQPAALPPRSLRPAISSA